MQNPAMTAMTIMSAVSRMKSRVSAKRTTRVWQTFPPRRKASAQHSVLEKNWTRAIPDQQHALNSTETMKHVKSTASVNLMMKKKRADASSIQNRIWNTVPTERKTLKIKSSKARCGRKTVIPEMKKQADVSSIQNRIWNTVPSDRKDLKVKSSKARWGRKTEIPEMKKQADVSSIQNPTWNTVPGPRRTMRIKTSKGRCGRKTTEIMQTLQKKESTSRMTESMFQITAMMRTKISILLMLMTMMTSRERKPRWISNITVKRMTPLKMNRTEEISIYNFEMFPS